jgi:hypothetical protein
MAAKPVVARHVAAPLEAPAPSVQKEDVVAPRPVLTVGSEALDVSDSYAEGLFAGLVGAMTIALWFLLLDALNGHPLYTPNLLGTALLRGGEGLDALETLPISLDVVLPFTWIHLLVFLMIGVAASRLLALGERDPNVGFGVLLFFVVFEFGFVGVSMVLAEPVLHALAWSEILVGNLLAAAAMTLVFRRRHPALAVYP